MTDNFSPYQKAIFDFVESGSGSGIVEAVAGSGKTTTIIKACELIDPSLATCFLAFNKSIATELAERAPAHVACMTLNGLGHRSVLAQFGRLKLDANKTKNIVKMILPQSFSEVYSDTIKLIGLAKANGIAPSGYGYTSLNDDSSQNFQFLADHYDLDITDKQIEGVYRYLIDALRIGIEQTNLIDFDDQLYIPVVLNIPTKKFDWLMVDEAQDVAAIQRALIRKALKSDGRLIAVGDPCQAIYGFRGADSDSLVNIKNEFSAKTFPLSISYRCSKAVVRKAQTVVNHIKSHDSAAEGSVKTLPHFDGSEFSQDDMIICRNTAPLISLAYSLIGRQIPCKVLGRDIGVGLIKLIDKLKARDISGPDGLIRKLESWAQTETERARDNGQEGKGQAIADKV